MSDKEKKIRKRKLIKTNKKLLKAISEAGIEVMRKVLTRTTLK